MTQVLIVSKTKMFSGVCIGGITLPDYRSVRLLNEEGKHHSADTDMSSGQLYEMALDNVKKIIPPHSENVIIISRRLLQDNIDVKQYITAVNFPDIFWKGSPEALFGRKLRWTGNRSGYISHEGGVPNVSTGFWISDRNVVYNNKYYSYTDAKGIVYRFKYVGFNRPLEVIPAKTKIRVSLAK